MASVVLLADEDSGLPVMIHGLLTAAAEHPTRGRVLGSMRGAVTIIVTDAEVEVGLRFAGGECHVLGERPVVSDVTVTTTAEALLELSSVPRLLGLPSPLAAEGRTMLLRILRREVRISGVRSPVLISQLMTVLAVT